MKGKTWVIFGCVLVGLSSYRYGAYQAAAVAMTEAGYRGDDPLTVPRLGRVIIDETNSEFTVSAGG